MERQFNQPRRFLPLKEFVASVPASMSTVRRWIKKGRLEHVQPDGPGTDIYIPDDAFERLVRKATEQISEQSSQAISQPSRRRSGPRPQWQSK